MRKILRIKDGYRNEAVFLINTDYSETEIRKVTDEIINGFGEDIDYDELIEKLEERGIKVEPVEMINVYV